MSRYLLLFFVFSLTINSYGQTNEVSLIVSSKGTTEEEAKSNALRSAIEQAFGTFVSARTEILDDELVQDQIVSVSNGNIKKFEILSSLFLPDQNLHLITLNATVSLDKLTSFVQSKGYNDVSFDGGGFAMNLKIQNLNASSEIIAVNNLVEQGLILSPIFFDRELIVGNPTLEPSNRVTNPKYQVPLTIKTSLNSNWSEYQNFYSATLKDISMSKEEIDTYKSVGKKVYQLVFLNVSYSRNASSSLTLTKGQQEVYNRIGFPLGVGDFKIIDTLSFRSPQTLTTLTGFHLLLNARYLDGTAISHDLDRVELKIDYSSEYRIGTYRDQTYIDYTPSNLWFYHDLPFLAYSEVETVTKNEQVYEPVMKKGKQVGSVAIGIRPTKVIQRPIISLSTYLSPIYTLTKNGYRLEPYEAKNEFYSSLTNAIGSSNYSSAISSISNQIYTKRMPGDFYYYNWSGQDFRNRIFQINNPQATNYEIRINLSFTEQELGLIKGFKLVK